VNAARSGGTGSSRTRTDPSDRRIIVTMEEAHVGGQQDGESRLRDRRARPPRDALAWAVAAVGPAARLVSVRPLLGGISSAVHGLVIEDLRGVRHRLVMRRWLGEPAAESLIRNEATALVRLSRANIPAPRLVASDASGGDAGCPVLLMEQLPGRVNLAPRDVASWLGQLARVLPGIHALQVDLAPFDQSEVHSEERGFEWSSYPEMWERAMELINGEPSTYEPHFIHGDFQHFNTLWSRERLSGIVDWTFSSLGPRELDTGRCRLNLAVLFSAECAERFRLFYEAEAGRTLDPWWDLYSLASYGPDWPLFIPEQVGRRASVDIAGMHRRVDELLLTIMRRL
jgi:aminoglycoside phosphotransferase (APT) family kinase protein